MHSVATRLGMTPPPVYARVGNKAALLDAIAERLLTELVPDQAAGESWQDYARRWAASMRSRLIAASDSRLIMQVKRPAYVNAWKPLAQALSHAGFTDEQSIRACRLRTWATVGFAALDHPPIGSPDGSSRIAAGNPDSVSPAEVDELFVTQIDYAIAGLERDAVIQLS